MLIVIERVMADMFKIVKHVILLFELKSKWF